MLAAHIQLLNEMAWGTGEKKASQDSRLEASGNVNPLKPISRQVCLPRLYLFDRSVGIAQCPSGPRRLSRKMYVAGLHVDTRSFCMILQFRAWHPQSPIPCGVATPSQWYESGHRRCRRETKVAGRLDCRRAQITIRFTNEPICKSGIF